MDYQIQPRSGAVTATTSRTPVARYVNAGMTCVVAMGFICEGFWLSRDPAFAVGGVFAGATLAIGALGLIFGSSWLLAILRDRR